MRMTPAAPGVTLVEGRRANWAVLHGDGKCVLIDSGYPKDLRHVRESIRFVLGHDAIPEAVYVTHAHSDHIGAASWYHRLHGVPVFVHEQEIPNARREVLHQVTFQDVRGQIWNPRMLRWVIHAVLAGALQDVAVQSPTAIPASSLLTATGHQLHAVNVAAHTPGSVAYFLPNEGVAITGDTFVSAHELVAAKLGSPGVLPDIFHYERDRLPSDMAVIAEELRESVNIVLPGHGPLMIFSNGGAASDAIRHLAANLTLK